jgi:hypothetical protein
MGCVCL